MIESVIYLLCAVTSGLCAALLLRAHLARANSLLFWIGAAFCVFTLSNVLLFVDLVVFPATDLSPFRTAATLLGVGLLLWGLIWENVS